MSSVKEKFGKRMKELRKAKKLTQEQLAEFINIEPQNISKIECGMHFPQPEKLEKLANAFGVNISDLFEFEHFNRKEELIKYITNSLQEFDIKSIEMIYKFVYNLKLLK